MLGTICLGLVWGWLLVRRLRGNRWVVVVRMLVGLAAQSLVVAALVKPLGLLWFAGGLLAGILLAAIWVLALEQRALVQ
jgi:hypothetical protein